MMMNRAIYPWILLVLFCALSPLNAQNGYDPNLDAYLHSLSGAEAPGVISEHLVLTYSSRNPVRYVAAAFEHEDFTRMHIYEKNQNGVFVFAYPLQSLPRDRQELKYRIIVDGLWMRDPSNPKQVPDSRGIPISVSPVPQRPPRRGETPVFHSDGTVEFVYLGSPGQKVRLAGDFNHWSPFSHSLKESSPGEYRLRLRLYKGYHRYVFYVNGSRATDIRNPRIAYDVLGNQVSAVRVPKSDSLDASLAEN
ncbi:hypothetical protein [Marispirochaeta aestuarii]|uniref:hypothetical protein n=1 Tax=Marispirochaeta aestuarii TaxID=1963862 RepID=UPI0029C8FCD0|nr:hypothetical protein [Marispirochaeta aestuarii]